MTVWFPTWIPVDVSTNLTQTFLHLFLPTQLAQCGEQQSVHQVQELGLEAGSRLPWLARFPWFARLAGFPTFTRPPRPPRPPRPSASLHRTQSNLHWNLHWNLKNGSDMKYLLKCSQQIGIFQYLKHTTCPAPTGRPTQRTCTTIHQSVLCVVQRCRQVRPQQKSALR